MKETLQKCCSECREIKPESEFYRNGAQKDGYCNLCKSCDKARHFNWRKKNSEVIYRYHRENMAKDLGAYRERNRRAWWRLTRRKQLSIIRCPKCGSRHFYDERDGDLTCFCCGKVLYFYHYKYYSPEQLTKIKVTQRNYRR